MADGATATAEEQYTDAQLQDGTTLRFKGQLQPEEVKQKVADYRIKQKVSNLARSAQPTQFEKENKPSMVGRVMSEAAALPARVAGVNVEKDPVTNWAMNLVRMAGQVVNPGAMNPQDPYSPSGPPQFMKDIVHQMGTTYEEGKREFSDAAQPGAYQAKRGGPILNTQPETTGEKVARKVSGATRVAASFLPILGPGAMRAGHELATGEQGDTIADLGDVAALTGQAALMTKPGQAAAERVVSPLVRPIARGTSAVVRAGYRGIVKGEPPTFKIPEAPQAMRQAIQPGQNVPRAGESIEIAGPRMKQVAQEQGIELRRVTGEKGEVTGKALDLVKASKEAVHKGIEQRLGPVADLSPDTTPVAEAMEKSISGRTVRQFPQTAEAINARAATYRGNLSLREIENSIQDANNSLRNFYKRPGATDSPTSADTEATVAEVKALRSLLDEKVETLSGEGVKDLKREYGALRDVERSLARQHAVQTRVKGATLWEGLAYLHAAGDLITGNALGALRAGGVLTVGKMLKNLRDPDFLLEKAFHGPKAFRAAEPIAPHGGPPPPAGLLPAPATELGFTQEETPPSREGRWVTPKALLPETAGQTPTGRVLRAAREKPTVETTAKVAPQGFAKPARSTQEENELRGEIQRTQQKIRATQDKMGRARTYQVQRDAMDELQVHERRLAQLKEAQEKGTPIKLGVRGANKEELTQTYRSLEGEEKEQVEALLEIYQKTEGPGRQEFIDHYGLNRGEWKGLPLTEKIARAIKGEKYGAGRMLRAAGRMREPGED